MISLSVWSTLWIVPAAFVSFFVLPPLLNLALGARKLRHVPTIGHDFPVLSYLSAFSYITNGRQIVQEGYDKYKEHGGAFKMPTLAGWMVVLAKRELIEELRRASDADLSPNEAFNKSLAIDYTFAPLIHRTPIHIPIIRSRLTRAVASLVPDMRDELVHAMGDVFGRAPVAAPLEGKGLEGEWKVLPAMESVLQVVCRTSNRVFVGLPVCRDPEFCRLNIRYAISVIMVSNVLNTLPYWLRPVIGPVCRSLFPYTAARSGLKHLEPTLKAMLSGELETNGMLQWLVDAMHDDPNPEIERTPHALMMYILSVNFASIHTSSVSFVSALYVLAAHPEWAAELRREVEQVLEDDGGVLTKAGLSRMKRADSFFREMSRLFGLGALVMQRLTLRPMRFRAEGLTLPADTSMTTVALPRHLDPEVYDRPREFDPWRFVGDRYAGEDDEEAEDGDTAKTRGYLFVNTSPEFLQFGHGKHACPGRFFASVALKSMLAHIVTEYDVRLEGTYEPTETTFGLRIPPPMWFGAFMSPNGSAKVLMRKRAKA